MTLCMAYLRMEILSVQFVVEKIVSLRETVVIANIFPNIFTHGRHFYASCHCGIYVFIRIEIVNGTSYRVLWYLRDRLPLQKWL
jgi:hypothetical protein